VHALAPQAQSLHALEQLDAGAPVAGGGARAEQRRVRVGRGLDLSLRLHFPEDGESLIEE